MFNLTEFDHVEKFTVYDAIEFLRNERKMSLDITLLVLFCNVLNRRKDTININVYGQVHGGYRYKITDGNKKILDGEWSELESVYSWYNNPDNPNYCNINYEFEDEEIRTLKTYFFDKNELMQFLGFHSAKYNQDEQQKDKITAHQNKGITNNNNPDEIARLNAIIEQQTETIARLEAEVENLKKTETAQATQPPTVDNSKKRYNPTERETHLQIIYGLVEKLTKKDINHSKYQRGNNINKSSIARGIAEEVQGLFIDPRDTEGFRDRLTKILEEAE